MTFLPYAGWPTRPASSSTLDVLSSHLDYPDFAVLDLDQPDKPPIRMPVQWPWCSNRYWMNSIFLSLVKTSGATGLHIYLPVKPEYTYEEIRLFTRSIARNCGRTCS